MIRNDESTAGSSKQSRQPRNESKSSSNSDYERSALVSAWSDEDDSENSEDSEESEVSDESEVDYKESGRDESSSADEHCNGHIALISRKRYNQTQTSLKPPSQESIIILDHSASDTILAQSEPNKILDHSESNIILDHNEPNIILDHSESNIILDHIESDIIIDHHSENDLTPTSNISKFTLAFEQSTLSSEINEIHEINAVDDLFVPLTSPKHDIFPTCDQPDTGSASDQPNLSAASEHSCIGLTSDQPCISLVSDQSVSSMASDQPCIGLASDQPCIGLASDQSVSSIASDQPCIGLASDRPDSNLASDQPVCSLASDQHCFSLTSDQPSVGLASEQSSNSLDSEKPSNSLASEQPSNSLASDQLEQSNKSSGSNTISDVGSDQAKEEQPQNEQKQTPVFQKTITPEEILEEASKSHNLSSVHKVAYDFYKPNLVYEETSSFTDTVNKPIAYSETDAASHDITENIDVSDVNSVNNSPRLVIDDVSDLISLSEEHTNPPDELNLNELDVENNLNKAENKTSLRNKGKHIDTNKDNELKENCSSIESTEILNCHDNQNQLLRNQEENDLKDYNDCQFAIECKQLNDDINQVRDKGEVADHDAQGNLENDELRVESDLTILNLDQLNHGIEPTEHENGQDVLKTNQLDSVLNFSAPQGDQNTKQKEISQEFKENELIKSLFDLSKADILLHKTGLEIAELSESDIILETVLSRERKHDFNNELYLHHADDTIEIKDDAENQSETFKNQSEIELNQSDPIDIIDKVLETTDQIVTNEKKLQETNLENQAIVENEHDQEQKEHCQDESELNEKISSESQVNSALDITDEHDIGSDDEGSEFSISDLSWYKEYLGPLSR